MKMTLDSNTDRYKLREISKLPINRYKLKRITQ